MSKPTVPHLLPRITLATLALTAALSAGTAQAAPLTLDPASPTPTTVGTTGDDTGSAALASVSPNSNAAQPGSANSASRIYTFFACILGRGTWTPGQGCSGGISSGPL
ncbi:hypothetical protein ACFVUS_34830 [Nocardia sp. NPDC058058]|uniref:hypothetical protein n=1 Tax=Nocardia sp. NPDC058058 TaxID=3346317 RepID=UPI0036D7FEA3